MIHGKTETGFEFTIEKARLENYELLEAIAEEETGSPTASIKIVNLLLGDEAQRLKDHVRDENGFVPVQQLGAEIRSIFEAIKDLKN